MQNSLADKVRLAKDYLQFRLAAKSRFSIHSPFLFELVNDVFRDKRDFYAFRDIENIRHGLLADSRVVQEEHYGEQSKTLPAHSRAVREIARVTALPDAYGKLLFRLVNHLRPANLLELGTGLGVSTLYLSAAATSAPFITLEASSSLAVIAKENFQKLQLHNIRLLQGKFSDTLPQALNELKELHFVFIDGDHRKEAVINNVHQLLPHLANNATIVVDDIYWSQEMKEAWNELIRLPQATLSVDLFRMGVLFFREGVVKQHLKVVTY